MVATRRRNLTDDLLSDLIRAEADGERLTAEELRALVGTLLMAGTDTTRNQLAASVEAALRTSPSMGAVGTAPRDGAESRRGNHAVHADSLHSTANGYRGRRTRRGVDSRRER